MAKSLRLWWHKCGKAGKLLLMAVASLIVGVIALILAVGLYIKGWAAKSVLTSLRVRVLANPISDGQRTYWVVELIANKGNFLCRILDAIDSNLVSTQLYAKTTFEMPEGRYSSFAHDIEYGIRDKMIEFTISPKVTRQLVVVQRTEDLYLRTMGDSFGYSCLQGSGNLIITLFNAKRKIVKQFKIDSYIKNGNPNVAT